MNNESRGLSNHILPTSANLLGICFVIFSFIKVSDASQKTYLDDFLAAPILFFFLASIFSYFSLRASRSSGRYELLADWFFLFALVLLTACAFIFIFQIIH